jgi:transposase
MSDNFWLSDAQWAAIAPLLPMVHTGPVRQDDRRIISGILHRLREGCRWPALPAEYGPYPHRRTRRPPSREQCAGALSASGSRTTHSGEIKTSPRWATLIGVNLAMLNFPVPRAERMSRSGWKRHLNL